MFYLEREPLVDDDDQPVLYRHVPALEGLSHGRHKVAAPLVNVVHRLEVDLAVLSLGAVLVHHVLQQFRLTGSLAWPGAGHTREGAETGHYAGALGQDETRVDSHPGQQTFST